MSGLVEFMNGPIGRVLRIVVGVALIWYGFVGPGGGTTLGIVLGVLGIGVGILGISGRCLLNGLKSRSA